MYHAESLGFKTTSNTLFVTMLSANAASAVALSHVDQIITKPGSAAAQVHGHTSVHMFVHAPVHTSVHTPAYICMCLQVLKCCAQANECMQSNAHLSGFECIGSSAVCKQMNTWMTCTAEAQVLYAIKPWAVCYNTLLLIRLTLNCVEFPFLYLSMQSNEHLNGIHCRGSGSRLHQHCQRQQSRHPQHKQPLP